MNLMALANSTQYGTYSQRFEATMNGFRELRDQRILNIQPDRLRVTRAGQDGPFKALVGGNLPQELNPEDIAILNQVNLNTQIVRGQAVKLVGN